MPDRFMTISANYIPKDECWLLISDFRWWLEHEREIELWAKECLDYFETEGMVVKFTSYDDLTVFLMRWANG